MKIDIPEIKVDPTSNLFDLANYPSPGIYIADDGYMKSLVFYQPGGVINAMPLPTRMCASDVATPESDSTPPAHGFISEEGLLKAMAIVQDAKLAKELIALK